MRVFQGQQWPAAAIFAVAAILIVPLWCTAAPAMPDYPAHLATFWLISGGIRDSALAHFYRIAWGFIPNLAAEILVPALGRFVGLVVGVKLFLSAAVAMWVLAPAFAYRALFGRFGLGPLLAAFFAYNANFMWGFLNYYFAAGLAFAVFAAWIADSERSAPLRLAAFAVATTAIYFCHIFGAALLGFLLVAYEAGNFLERREFPLREVSLSLVRIVLLFVPAGIAFLFLRPVVTGGDNRLEFDLLDTLRDRVDSLIQFHYDRPAYPILIALILFLLLGIWRRWVSFHPRMTVVVLGLAFLSLFAPEWAMGGWGVDLRLPAVFGVFLFAAAEFKFPARATAILASVLVVIFGFTAASLAGNWRYYDTRYAEFRAASQILPHGSKIFVVLDGDAIGKASDQPYWHMAEFAIIDRGALTPLMFATKGQHVVYVNPPFDKWVAATANQGSPPDVTELDDLEAGQIDGDKDIRDVFPYLMRFQCHYDGVVLVHLNGTRSPVPDMLKLRRAGSFFAIYGIDKSDGCGRR